MLATLVLALATAVVDVAPHGPFPTIQSGLLEAEALVRAGHRDVEVRVASGYYRIKGTITLTPRDNGVHVVGVGKTMPRLVGGPVLQHWKPVEDQTILKRLKPSARAHVLECDLDYEDAIPDMGDLSERGFGFPTRSAPLELFFDGLPMQLARYPNINARGGGWLRIKSVPSVNTITYADAEPATWESSGDIWLLGYWQFDWAESYERATTLDPKTHTIEFGGAHFRYPPMPGRRFYFLNVLEELDQPGEWYVDRSDHRLYFWPPKPIDAGEPVASTLDGPMFAFRGASRIELNGLDLEDGRAGGVDIAGGSQNWVRNCVVRNFGTFGVVIQRATDSGVTGSDLTGLGEGGITLSGGDRKTLKAAHLLAAGNHIWAYARWCRTYKPGISVSGVGNVVRNNRINDAPHQAILLSGNDHLVEFNDISDVCTETGDAGAIYMGRDPTMRGNMIRFNRLSGLSPKVNTDGNYTGVMGVYLDDCWAGTTVFGNIFDMRGTGIMIGGGQDNTVANNVFLGCNPAIHLDARGKSWAANLFKHNTPSSFLDQFDTMNVTKPPYSTRYPRLASVLSGDPAFPSGTAIDLNVSLGGKWMNLLDHLTTNDFEHHDNYVSPVGGNLDAAFRLAPRKFSRIPVREIGLTSRRRPIDRLPK